MQPHRNAHFHLPHDRNLKLRVLCFWHYLKRNAKAVCYLLGHGKIQIVVHGHEQRRKPVLIIAGPERLADLAALFVKARPRAQAEADIAPVGVDIVAAHECRGVGVASAMHVQHRVAGDEHLLHGNADLARKLKAQRIAQGYRVNAAVYRFCRATAVVIIVERSHAAAVHLHLAAAFFRERYRVQIKPQAAPARDILNKAAAAAYKQL